MKKILVFVVAIFLITFFSMPSSIFGCEDEVKESEQYTIDDAEVYCIDDDTPPNNDDAYTETGEMVSDALQDVGPNNTAGIDEVNAEAVEIIATTATGASDEDNQDAVWDIIEGDPSPSGSTVEKIVEAVMTIADGFVNDNLEDLSLQEYLDEENVNEVEVILDSDPLVDANGDSNDEFIATAIMENPLVPGVTDQAKSVFWYIMAGSYNVSFSQTDLVVEATSTMNDYNDGTDGDAEDTDGDGEIDDNYGMATIPYYFYWWGEGYPEFEEMNACLFAWVDIDEDGLLDIQDLPDDGEDVVGDFQAANQVIKVQEDSENPGQHIIVDENDDGIADTEPVLEQEKQVEVEVEKTCTFGNWYSSGWYWYCWHSGHPHSGGVDVRWQKPTYTVTETETIPSEFDVCEGIGGMMLESPDHEIKTRNPDVCSNGHWDNDHYWHCKGHDCSADNNYYNPRIYWPCSNGHYGSYGSYYYKWYCDGHDLHSGAHEKYCYTYEPYQRFTIENYSEPFDMSCAQYSAWGSFDLYKGDSVTGDPVPGATYLLTYIEGQTYTPEIIDYLLTTDINGVASVGGLPWGTYGLNEVPPPPPGYLIDPNSYTVLIGGTALFGEEEEGNMVAAGLEVTDDRVPRVPPPTTTTTTTPGVITVLGIQELPFTGMNPVIPISGISTILAGGLMVMLSSIRRKLRRK